MDIFVNNKTPVPWAKKVISPPLNASGIKCGGCKGRSFQLHIQPLVGGGVRLLEVMCLTPKCHKVYKLDMASCFEQTAHYDENDDEEKRVAY